jgi:hypothetical protein
MTAFALKVIALASMLIDHLAVVFPDYFPFWLRGVGRLAWPIFAFLLAEGFRHTKSPEKFLMRLLVFALISEIPYDIAMGNSINFFSNTNIFYTLFLGGMAICWYERMKKWYDKQAFAAIGALLPTALLAEILSADYGGMGVLFIFAMYAIKPQRLRLAAVGVFALSQFIPLIPAYFLGISIRLEYWLMIPFALATVPLIAMYNGNRGTQAKWLFYWFYPAHLAVLAIIAAIISGFT